MNRPGGLAASWLADEICEVAVTEAQSGAPFSMTVRPTHLQDGPPGVHGIETEELRASQSFAEVFELLLGFLRQVSENALVDADSSDDECDLATGVLSQALPSQALPSSWLQHTTGSITYTEVMGNRLWAVAARCGAFGSLRFQCCCANGPASTSRRVRKTRPRTLRSQLRPAAPPKDVVFAHAGPNARERGAAAQL